MCDINKLNKIALGFMIAVWHTLIILQMKCQYRTSHKNPDLLVKCSIPTPPVSHCSDTQTIEAKAMNKQTNHSKTICPLCT